MKFQSSKKMSTFRTACVLGIVAVSSCITSRILQVLTRSTGVLRKHVPTLGCWRHQLGKTGSGSRRNHPGVRVVHRGPVEVSSVCGRCFICTGDYQPGLVVLCVLCCVRHLLRQLSEQGMFALPHCESLLMLWQVEFPEKVLKAEFVGELLFLPGASLCLIYFKSLELLIILVGVVWWLLSPDWIPEKPDPSKGSNPLFLAGWMCCSAVMSALLLSGVFIVRTTLGWYGAELIYCFVGIRGIRAISTCTRGLHRTLAHYDWRVQCGGCL